jgi:serpin B
MKKKSVLSLICLLLAALMLLSLVSCGIVPKASALSDGYTRKTTESGKVTDALVSSLSDFSFDLLQGAIADPNSRGNLLTSPLSAFLCLSLVTNGASGETLTQLENLLGMEIKDLNKALYAYTRSLSSTEDCKVKMANSVWFRDTETLHVKESYLQTSADWYDAEQFAAPFNLSTVKEINGWVENNTDGMIDSIIDDPSAIQGSVMYLINTLVFDAKWMVEYEKKQIRDDSFHNYDGSKTAVKMLCSDESIVLRPENGIGFTKKYKGGNYSFVALLPDEGTDIYDFAATLDGEKWLSMWNSKDYYPANVKIPEFSYEAGFDLKETLKALGATDMFDEYKADFSALATSENGNIYCSGVHQKCFIDVSRDGTKAAAVTWADMTDSAAEPTSPVNIFLDRPFVYAIVDNTTGRPLFLGIVHTL